MLCVLSFLITQVWVVILHLNLIQLLQSHYLTGEHHFWKLSTPDSPILSCTVKTSYMLVHIPATHHCKRHYTLMGERQGMSVSEVDNPHLRSSVTIGYSLL